MTYFVDTSVFASILLKETGALKFQKKLRAAKTVISSSLLEAELYAICKREKIEFSIIDEALSYISLLFPEKSLKTEYARIFSHGYCRGADAHHIACALYLDPELKNLKFLTADKRQMDIVKALNTV